MIFTTPLAKFLKKPSKYLKADEPCHVLTSRNTPQAALIKIELFEGLIKTDAWNQICEEWWEMHDKETVAVVQEGKKIMSEKKLSISSVSEI